MAQNEVTLAPASSFDTGRVSTYYAQVAADKNKENYGQAQIKVSRVSGLSSSAVTYQSNNTSVAEVSSTGFVTPKGAGVAVITVASKSNPNVTAEYRVMVKNLATYIKFQRFDKLRLEPDENDDVTKEGYRWTDLGFEVFPTSAENRNYKVVSDNEAVIEVKNTYDEYGDSVCTLILKSKGKATLTIKSDDGYVTEKWTIEVCNGDHLYGVGVQ